MTGRIGTGAALRMLLVVQLGMGAVLFASDLWDDGAGAGPLRALPRLFAPQPPSLDAPVRPGDQTRRYRRDTGAPARTGAPLPATNDMPARLSLAVDGDTIRLAGRIAPGDADRLADALRETADTGDGVLPGDAEPGGPPLRTALLDSPGGSVADALAIGRTLREAGLETEVGAGAVCLSACPYMLAGGAARRVDPDGFVGVHQHYFGESGVQPAFMAVEDVQRGQARVMVHLDAMGVDPLLMQHAMTTAPDEIYVLLPEELERYALITAP